MTLNHLQIFVPLAVAIGLLLGQSASKAAEPRQVIPCNQSVVQITPEQTCRKGPAHTEYGGQCVVNDYTAMYEVPNSLTYVSVRTVGKNYNPSCYMGPDPSFANDIKTELPRLRAHATDGSAPSPFGTQGMQMTFKLPERDCFAFMTMQSRYAAGYLYQIRGLMCGAVHHAPLPQSEIQQFISSIRLQ